jgi:hypothetical protein
VRLSPSRNSRGMASGPGSWLHKPPTWASSDPQRGDLLTSYFYKSLLPKPMVDFCTLRPSTIWPEWSLDLSCPGQGMWAFFPAPHIIGQAGGELPHIPMSRLLCGWGLSLPQSKHLVISFHPSHLNASAPGDWLWTLVPSTVELLVWPFHGLPWMADHLLYISRYYSSKDQSSGHIPSYLKSSSLEPCSVQSSSQRNVW